MWYMDRGGGQFAWDWQRQSLKRRRAEPQLEEPRVCISADMHVAMASNINPRRRLAAWQF